MNMAAQSAVHSTTQSSYQYYSMLFIITEQTKCGFCYRTLAEYRQCKAAGFIQGHRQQDVTCYSCC